MITGVAYEETPVNINTTEEVYTIVFDDERVKVSIADVIIKEIVEYLPEEDEVYDIEIDTSVPGVTYVGQAAPGTASSSAAWRIKKITDSAGGASVDWANGNANFVNVWDNHLAYTYGP